MRGKYNIIKTLGHNVKGKGSPLIHGKSLDALIDVMGDWLIESWGQKINIYITGANKIFELGNEFSLNIVQSFNDAFVRAIY